MLTLKEIREAYEELSGKASEICRQLGFAGIGIIWIFNTSTAGIDIPDIFNIPLFLICLSLGLDLAGYVLGTIIWYLVYLFNHNKTDSDETTNVKDPELINIVNWWIWVMKIGFMVWSYVLLARIVFNFKFPS